MYNSEMQNTCSEEMYLKFSIMWHTPPPICNSHVSVPCIMCNVFSGNRFLNCQQQAKVRFKLTINQKLLNINLY